MSFTRAKPSGWVTLDQITPAQINHIDVNQSNAIDGAAGGVYAPTSPIGLSNDLEIKSGAGIVLEVGAALTASAGTSIELNSDLDMRSGADIELGANSEIKTLNARTNRLWLPLQWRSCLETTSVGASQLPQHWRYANAMDEGIVGFFSVPIQDTATGTAENLQFAVPALPASATIVGFGMNIMPGAHASLPTTMPRIRLVRYTSAAVRTVVSTATDASALSPYQSAHEVAATGLSEAAVDRWYLLEVRGGYDGGAVANQLVIQSLYVQYTTTRVNHQHHEVTLA
jgi:hypothetical protein